MKIKKILLFVSSLFVLCVIVSGLVSCSNQDSTSTSQTQNDISETSTSLIENTSLNSSTTTIDDESTIEITTSTTSNYGGLIDEGNYPK